MSRTSDPDLAVLVDASTTHPKEAPLVCRRAGSIVLGGLPAPTYTCQGCGAVRHSLADLTPRRAA